MLSAIECPGPQEVAPETRPRHTLRSMDVFACCQSLSMYRLYQCLWQVPPHPKPSINQILDQSASYQLRNLGFQIRGKSKTQWFTRKQDRFLEEPPICNVCLRFRVDQGVFVRAFSAWQTSRRKGFQPDLARAYWSSSHIFCQISVAMEFGKQKAWQFGVVTAGIPEVFKLGAYLFTPRCG